MDLKFDDDQLKLALGAIKPTPGLSPRLQNLKLIAEMVALACAGAWAFFIYWAVQEAAGKLSREQTKHKLEATINIDPKIAIRKLRQLSGARAAYEVKYRYDISVTSEKDTPIVFVALEWFIGTSGLDPTESFRANLPTTEGSIRWKSRGIEVHSKPSIDTNLLIGPRTDWSREIVVKQDSEGGVGKYEPGESVKEERTFYVAAKSDEWVGFNLTIGVERGNGKIEGYYSKTGESLAVETPQEKKVDMLFTRRMAQAAVVGVELVDHLVLGTPGRWASLKEPGGW